MRPAEADHRTLIRFHVVSCMQRIVQPVLVKQLNDLRTSVAKEACSLVVWLSMEYPQEFFQSVLKSSLA